MKYQQPYGISDPNAPYINGNPSTGTMGSIPPAKSIEDPQREMHNFIEKSFLTPQEADLQQIAKAVQSGQVVYSLDGGEVNKIVITPPVALGAYRAGQRFVIKMSYASTSQVTVNVSGLGQRPLIHTDLSPMNPFELIAGQIVEVAYDGSNFQLVAGGAPGGIVTLKGTSTVYVNDGTGSDTLYDGTQPAPIGVMGGPFKTIQKALSTMQKYNLGGQYFNIMVADGVYANAGPVNFPMPNGSGWVQIIGNISNPSAVSIFNTGTGSCWYIREGGNYAIHGVIFRATAPRPGDNGCGVWLGAASFVVFGDCHWNNMGHNGTTWTGAGIQVGPGGYGFVVGDQTIKGQLFCPSHRVRQRRLLRQLRQRRSL